MVKLSFGVLGPLEVWRDGAPVEVPSGRRRAVLACLLVNLGRPVTSDELVHAAWGDDLPERPHAALNTVLSRLRRALGRGVVQRVPAGYVLNIPAEDLDAHRFEMLRDAAADREPEQALRMLREALALWRGPAYLEFTELGSVSLEAQRLDLLRLDTIESSAALSIESGDIEPAIARLESLLAEQPFREHAVHLLMTALYRSGRVTDALDRYRSYRATLADELGLDPTPSLQDLELRILGHDLPPAHVFDAPPSPPAWLDTSAAFVGREDVLGELEEAVATNRLVTVTGVGGVGKTRLVVESLPVLGQSLGVAVTIVELAGVSSRAVDAAVGEALGLNLPPDGARRALVEYLSITEGLLILDNCEHLQTEVASLVEVLGRRCPRIRVLATSRHRLGLHSERVLPLAPLATPAEGQGRENAGVSPAVRLFEDRIRRLTASSAIVGQSKGEVGEICRLVDGLPLALELAAARAAVVGLEPVRDHLAQTLASDVAPRQEAGYDELRDLVDWSYGLLSESQQRIFARLSVFVGDFDVAEAAEMSEILAEGDGDIFEVPGTADAVAELANASLLALQASDDAVRYRMLAIVKSFAAARLVASGEEPRVRLAHSQWVRRLVQWAAAEHLGRGTIAAFTSLDRHRGDIESGLRWALDTGRLSLAGDITGSIELCRQWPLSPELGDLVVATAEKCAELPDQPALPLAAGACVLADRGDLARSRELGAAAAETSAVPAERFLSRVALGVATIYAGAHEDSFRWWREITHMDDLHPAHRAEGHISLALLACFSGELDTARQQAATALTAAEIAGSPAVHAFARYAEGEVVVQADLAHGSSVLGAAAIEADRAGAAHVSRVARLAQLAALVRLGRSDEALHLVGPLLDDERRAGVWPQLWTTMRILAELVFTRGMFSDAAFLLAAADASDTAPRVTGDDVARYRKLTAQLRGHLGGGVVDGIGELAVGTSRTQVIDRALAILDKLRRGSQ